MKQKIHPVTSTLVVDLRSIHTCRCPLVSLTLILSIFWMSFCYPSFAEDSAPHYCYNRQRIPLKLILDRVGVLFDQSVTQSAREQSLLSESFVACLEPSEKALGYQVATIKPPHTSEQIWTAIERLRQKPNIRDVRAVFGVGSGLVLPTDEVIVRFQPGISEAGIQSKLSEYGLAMASRGKSRNPSSKNRVIARLTDVQADSIRSANLLHEDPIVISAEPNFLPVSSVACSTPNDPFFQNQWNLKQNSDEDIDADEAWDTVTGSTSVIIAYIDAGIDLNHEDLNIWTNPGEIENNQIDDDENGYVDDIHGWDFAGNDKDPAPYGYAHGVAAASIGTAKGNNSLGIAGVCQGATIMPVKMFYDNGSGGTTAMIVDAIEYAVDNGAHILGQSWHLDAPSDAVRDAIQYARYNGRGGKGCPVVFSAGNEGVYGVQFPAALPECIAVGAVDASGGLWDYSSQGEELDVTAPSQELNYVGNSIYSADISGSPGWNSGTPAQPDASGNYTYRLGGTSAASPHVSGLAGLLIAYKPSLTAAQVQAIIAFSAEGKGDSGRDPLYGYGRINAHAAIHLSEASRVQMLDANSLHLASFDDGGNLVIEGNMIQNADSAQLTPQSNDFWVLRDSSSNCVARITASGDMVIKGAFAENQGSLSLTNALTVFRDAAGNAVNFLDTSGNLYLIGRAFFGLDPDRASSQGK